MELEKLIEVLQATVLFRDALPEDLTDLIEHIRLDTFEDGAEVFAEGADGTRLYLVLEGSVDVCKQSPGGRSQKLATLPEGAIFGEIGFLSGAARSASAHASGPTRLASVGWGHFEPLLVEGRPVATGMLLSLARVMSSRLALMGDELVKLVDDAGDGPVRNAEIAELRRKLLTDWNF